LAFRRCRPCIALHEPERPSARELFFALVTGNLGADSLISSIPSLSNDLEAEKHHTRTKKGRSRDFSIRAYRSEPRPALQNAVTLK
jgi:hypothetical protein